MRRLVLLFAALIVVISLGESRRHHRHQSEEFNYDRMRYISDRNDYRRFRDLAKDVIDADKTSRKYCSGYSYMNEMTEMYGIDGYRLNVPAKGVNKSEVTVKIKHRTVFVKVEKDSKGDTETVLAKFVALPDIVDEDKATWTLSDDRIQIAVPYEVEFGKEMPVSCEDDVDKDTKDVKYKEVSTSDDSTNEPFNVTNATNINEIGV